MGTAINPYNKNSFVIPTESLSQLLGGVAASRPIAPPPERDVLKALQSEEVTPKTFGAIARAKAAQGGYGDLIANLLGIGGKGTSYGVNAMNNINEPY